MKILALIDGEHYLPITKAALLELQERYAATIAGVVFLGGIEKLKNEASVWELGFPAVLDPDRLIGLQHGLVEFRPDLVYDLSDEPIVTAADRFKLANIILSAGVPYAGPDFRFDPPQFANVMTKPSLTIAGTGKRIGKTAIGGYVGRVLSGQEPAGAAAFCHPCIVTMGRGGPAEPQIIPGEELSITAEYLLNEVRQGKHASSDHYEDALTARVTTIGCRRCGGGFAGQVFSSVVHEGARLANQLPHDFVIFEGSGAAVPPILTDAWLTIVGGHLEPDLLTAYLTPFRIRPADLIIVTLCEKPLVSDVRSLRVEQLLREINPTASIIRTRFRPQPLQAITGKTVLWVTTAPEVMAEPLKIYLETQFNCRITHISHSLSNRPRLREELTGLAMSVDTVLVELKAAAVDVVTEWGLANNVAVVYQDNIPEPLDNQVDLAAEIIRCAELAKLRFACRK